jgi:transcriptional regulator with XRE-family HTH domain
MTLSDGLDGSLRTSSSNQAEGLTPQQQVGSLVRLHRKARRLTQQQLADAAKRSVEMINKIENGRAEPSFDTLFALAECLQVPVRDMFGLGAHEVQPQPDDLADLIRSLAEIDAKRRAEVVRVLQAMLDTKSD